VHLFLCEIIGNQFCTIHEYSCYPIRIPCKCQLMSCDWFYEKFNEINMGIVEEPSDVIDVTEYKQEYVTFSL